MVGEAPSNAKSCAETSDKNLCKTFHADDQAYFDKVSCWTTPRTQCGDDRGSVCKDYAAWVPGLDRDQGLGGTTLRRDGEVQLGLLLSGPLGWLAVAYLGSLAVLFVAAFWQLDDFSGEIVKEPTFDELQAAVGERVYRTIALRTIGIAALVTVTDALLAFPIAFFMAKVATPRMRGLLVVGMLMPLWASYLVKVYAWREILSEDGILNWALGAAGDQGARLRLRRHLAGLQLPVAAVHDPAHLRGLERIPASMLDASGDLGGNPGTPSAAWCCRWPCPPSSPGRSSPSR